MRENGPYPVARQTSAVSDGDVGIRWFANGYPVTGRKNARFKAAID